jgi:hypothetical protein
MTKLVLTMLACLAFALQGNSQTNKVERQENWTFGIGGVGSTSTKGDGLSAFGLGLDIGRTGKLLLPIQTGVRQSISYLNDEGSQTLLTTAIYNDWTFLTFKSIELFGGANVACTYGNTKPLWVLAPEAGTRWNVKDDVAIVGRIQYGFDLNNNARQQNALGYQIYVQFKF